MKKVFILVGLPSSGKTNALNIVKENRQDAHVITSSPQEQTGYNVKKTIDKIKGYLRNKKDTIFIAFTCRVKMYHDDTAITKPIDYIKSKRHKVKIFYLDVSERNLIKRTKKDRHKISSDNAKVMIRRAKSLMDSIGNVVYIDGNGSSNQIANRILRAM